MDLFFYREPEEAKQHEDEEAVAPLEYAPGPDYGISAAANTWDAPVADGWTAEMITPPAATGSWTAEPGIKYKLHFI